MEALFGRMVTAPSATSSWSSIGEFFAPQLSEPTNKKWPVRLAFLAACNTRLKDTDYILYLLHTFYHGVIIKQETRKLNMIKNIKLIQKCKMPGNIKVR